MISLDYYKIGQRIRKFRKAHGFSQEDLAEKVRISTTHMSHIETGNTKLSLPVLVDIATVLEVRTDDLLCDLPTAFNDSALEEIAAILADCTPKESKVIVDIARTAKVSVKKYL